MKINGIHHINVETKDMDKAVKFYEENLGCTKKYHKNLDGIELTFMDAGNTIIELFKVVADENKVPVDGVINHYAFSVTDIESIVEKCRANGVKITQEIKSITLDNKIRFAFIEGPEHERIELFEYL
jgi:lactoylglutathione lyase